MPANPLADMQRLAAPKGGRCVSPTYLGSQISHEWECARGHRWKTKTSNIQAGHWCRVCANQDAKPKRHSLEACRAVAEEKGGRCLSKGYKNPRTKMLWECSLGHTWEAVFDKVQRGQWCSVCHRSRGQTNNRKRLLDAVTYARDRGGECLSPEWRDPKFSLSWRCKEGHQWQASTEKVYRGIWCPVCAKAKKPKVANLLASAARLNWKVTLNTSDIASVECCAGHQFERRLSSPSEKLSCNFCCAEVKDGIRERAAQTIQTANGTVVSDDGSAFTISCGAGHSFRLGYKAITEGRWCDDCARTPGSLQKTRRKPQSKLRIDFVESVTSFKCVRAPKTYRAQTLMTWHCLSGHQFDRQLQHTTEKGCPSCAGAVVARADALQVKGLRFLDKDHFLYHSKSYNWSCKCGSPVQLTYTQAVEGGGCPKCHTDQMIKKEILENCRAAGIKVVNLEALSTDGSVSSAFDFQLNLVCKSGHSYSKSVKSARHTSAGVTCPDCNRNESLKSTRKYGLEFFRSYAKERGGVCKNTSYERTADTLHFECKYGHDWSIMARYLISAKSWCSKCKVNRGEEYTRQAFEYLFDAEFPTAYPSWLKHIRPLELDGYNEKLSIAFEHQGDHHFGVNSFRNTDAEISNVLERDETKRRQCREAGVALIEVPSIDNITDRKIILNVIHAIAAAGLSVPSRPIDDFRLQALIADDRFERLRRFIDQKKGKLVEEKYLGARSHHRYICDKGHETVATPDNLYHGKWCNMCRGAKTWETRRRNAARKAGQENSRRPQHSAAGSNRKRPEQGSPAAA